MTNRRVAGYLIAGLAVLLGSAISVSHAAEAAAGAVAKWQKTAAGTYEWADAANWSPAVPNGPGATADFRASRQSNITVVVREPVKIGTLIAGDADGKSSLTVKVESKEVFDCSIGTVDLGGHGLGLMGPARTNDGSGATGVSWQVGTMKGKGQYILNGTGTQLLNDSPDFTGLLGVSNGWFEARTAALPRVEVYVVAGAFANHKKYPRGGRLQIGAHYPPMAKLPDRLNHSAVMAFQGGFLDYRGQGLEESLRGKAVVEQVRQIKFLSGMSQIRMINGNEVSASTTLLVNDPNLAMDRRPGATLMIGGDDKRSAKGFTEAMGVAEKLIFASGVAPHLKGGGGPAGSKNVSIIPWITLGTFYHPGQGQLVTYDKANGIRCLTAGEYYTGKALGCPPESNVQGSNVNLGAGQTQTINAYTTEGWDKMEIGAGSTLKITSGMIRFGSGPFCIGAGKPAEAGTIDFGPAEGIIWTGFETPYGPNIIGSVLAGSGGLTMAGNNVLVLKAANTYTGLTCVGSGVLQVGDGTTPAGKLGDGNVEVDEGGTLCIKAKAANAILDTASVDLRGWHEGFCGVMDLDAGVNETVGRLKLGFLPQPAGTYGSSASAATHKMDNYFTGTGILTVTNGPATTGPATTRSADKP
jgi:hypothetical protein